MADELLDQFLIEGRELVARALDDLAGLTGDLADRACLDGLFRTVHTLKGSVAVFDLPALGRLLHGAETLLEAARIEGRLDQGQLSAAEETLDLVDAWLDALETGSGPAPTLLERTDAVSLQFGDEGGAPAAPAPAEGAGWPLELAKSADHRGPLVAVRYRPATDAYFRGEDPLAVVLAVPGLVKLTARSDADAGPDYNPFECRLEFRALSSAPISDVRAALRLVGDEVELTVVDAQAQEPAEATAGAQLRSVRVDAASLDSLASLVDELVIAKNALAHDHGETREAASRRAVLDRVVAELHAAVTAMRLVGLGRLFGRFPRQVREIGRELGKEVEFVVSGGDVAVDKAVVEGLYEPLLHLIRNALDHGLESGAERLAAGKRQTAVLSLSARAAGETITVDVSDDGRGLDLGRIRAKAVQRGVASQEEAAALSDAEAADLIFAPGFSTAAEVSDLSGRGVGMDAVRTAVAALGGRITLINRPGQGLTVRLLLPASVVLAKVLAVKAGGESFGVPLDTVAEMHRVRRDEVQSIRAGRAYVRREAVTPLLRLSDLLGLQAAPDDESFPVISLPGEDGPVGVQIDEIGERFEAPLRPMGGVLSGFPGVLGTVLRGDGQVLLVLDMRELTS
jgi:two-component system chemotaxis sensor kinase CheA